MGMLELIIIAGLAIWLARQNNRLGFLETEVRALHRRLLAASAPAAAATVGAAEENAAVSEPIEETAAAPLTASSESVEAIEQAHTGVPDGPWAQPAKAAAPETVPSPAMDASAKPNIETALGTKWAVWVGGLALAFGGLFLVRYSIEAGLLGPATRLSLAAAFGLVLLGIGEFVRRTGFKVPVQGLDFAYVPSILTAAGAFTLFGAIYAAHGVYGFIGPAMAFVLLGAVALATLALALIHGLPLAGLGLLGALTTPLLVASESPNPWSLFVYLAIVLAAAVAVARIRIWPMLAAAAEAGVGLWTMFYMVTATAEGPVVLFIAAVMVAVLAFIWLRGQAETSPPLGFAAPAIIVAIFGAMIAPALSIGTLPDGPLFAAAILALMLAAAAWRVGALPVLHGAGVGAMLMIVPLVGDKLAAVAIAPESQTQAEINALWPAGWMVLALFLAAGLFMAWRTVAVTQLRAAFWAGWAAFVPVVAAGGYWALYGTPDIDLFYATVALALTLIYAAASEAFARNETPRQTGGHAVSAVLAGAGTAAVIALHAGFSPAWTTTLVGVAAAIPALATRWRSYPALGWLSVAAFVVCLARIAYDPSLVWPDWTKVPSYALLLQGYALPALAFAYAAWQLARTTDGRPRLVMEVGACLFALLTAAVLVRRAMSGGDFYGGELTLAEQSIYTLIALGAGGALIAIGQRSPSIVMSYGSMILGVASTALAALLHFGALNPLFTDESTGRIPVLNLLFLAYLLSAVGAAAVALYARGKRPRWYSSMLGLLASLLAFAYLTLSVRRWYQGEFIGLWRDTSQLETYSYSALWLVFGVILLVIGVRLSSYILRIASAALIAIAVVKVFVLDMSALQGVLRALSFIGLGAVLIGIGLFYQRLLAFGQPKADTATPPEPAPAAPPELP
jgi:uncharacterized membrane protein